MTAADADDLRRLGAWIAKERDRRGMTQVQLATAAGISPSQLSEIERGQGIRGPNTSTRRQLEQALELRAGTLTAVLSGADSTSTLTRDDQDHVVARLSEMLTLMRHELDDLADRLERVERGLRDG